MRVGKSRRDDPERRRAVFAARERPARALAGLRDRERRLARRRGDRSGRGTGVVALGAGGRRCQPRRADGRRPLAALALARQQLDPPAARGDPSARSEIVTRITAFLLAGLKAGDFGKSEVEAGGQAEAA